MPSFPKGRSRQLVAVALALVLCGGAMAVDDPFAAASSNTHKPSKKVQHLQQKQAQIKKQLGSVEGSLDDASDELTADMAKLTSLKAQLKDAQDRLTDFQSELAAVKTTQQQLAVQLVASRQALVDSKSVLVVGQQAVAAQ